VFKELDDLKDICRKIIEKSDKIKSMANGVVKALNKIKSETEQENAVEKTLAVRKELASMFVLHSDIEDSYQTLKKIVKSIEKLNR
jgi:hypothetical protein